MSILTKILGIDRLFNQIGLLQTSRNVVSSVNVGNQIFPNYSIWKDIVAYQTIDDIYSVVKMLANTSAMIPMYADAVVSDEGLPPNDPLVKLIRTMTTQKRVELFTFLYGTGEAFGFKNKLDLGVNKGVYDLTFMHPSSVNIVLSTGFPTRVLGYVYQDLQQGFEINLLPEEIIHFKYFNPSNDYFTKWRGFGPVQALAHRLTRLKAGMDASVSQLQNGGVPGIVYEKSENFDVENFGLRQERMQKFFNNVENKGAPYNAVGEMGYIQLGLPLADLDVAELQKIDFQKVCNAFNISSILFNNDAASTESNVKEMKKQLYTNAIMPTLKIVQDGMNNDDEISAGYTKRVEFDLSDVIELQEDMGAKATAIAALPTFVPNEVREVFGYDRIDDPLMDIPYIKTGYQPLSDFNSIPDVSLPNE
jgi:HK97 family phage portal protein